jgi:hypothetical protein
VPRHSAGVDGAGVRAGARRRVPRPSRHVAPVVGVSAEHPDLVAGVELRDARQREEGGERQRVASRRLVGRRVRRGVLHEPRQVVVVEHVHEVDGARLAERRRGPVHGVGHAVHRAALGERIDERALQREVERRVEPRAEHAAEVRVRPVEVLGHEEEALLCAANRRHEGLREVSRGHVLRGVHAEAVGVQALHPALRESRDVRGDDRVLLGEIGQTVERAVHVVVAELRARRRVVEPVGVLRRDARAAAGVVDHHVEDEAHPSGVQVARQRVDVRDAAELRLDRAVVGVGEVGPVPVVAARAVAQRDLRGERRRPDGRDAESREVRDALAQAGEVAAVEEVRVGRPEAASLAGVVVGGVAVLEAVRKDEVQGLLHPVAGRGGRRGARLALVHPGSAVRAARRRRDESHEPPPAHARESMLESGISGCSETSNANSRSSSS